MKKILYGVCGIGSGHTHRQLPLIEHFSKSCRIVIFAYGYGYDFYSDQFKDSDNISVIKVAVKFYVGNESGIDFKATEELPRNKGVNFDEVNNRAQVEAYEILEVPDLVISDYEPVSAQYAYKYDVPFITIDQQSKYLCGTFPTELSNYSYQDEIARLHLFFPKAQARIACSFFNVPILPDCSDEVEIFPPVFKDEIIKMDYKPSDQKNILIYISAARDFIQTPEDILRICSQQQDIQFHVFLGSGELFDPNKKLSTSNVTIYQHDDPRFYQALSKCHGIVSTAGHSLLSEAMYLGIPVYAIPVGPYEQHMNAYIIDKHGFGMSWPKLSKEKLDYFISNIDKFKNTIRNDKKILLREIGQKKIINFIEARLF